MKKIIISVVIPVIIFFVTFGVGYAVYDAYLSGRQPSQPINFSHKIHAGDNQVPCLYCHIYAERSPSSGVPNVQRCMGCHNIIKTDAPEIQKLAGFWERKEPIPWIKVHNLPDYVYFPHKRHVKAKLKCQECHGPIETMPVVRRVSSPKMGWCLKCHTKKKVENGRDCWTCHE